MAKAKGNGKGTGSFDAQIAKVITLAEGLKTAIAALGLPGLTAEQRVHTDGRLRQGEAAAITTIFETIDAFPSTFAALADKDGGSDPDAVETASARTALAEATALQPLGALLTTIEGAVSDAVLALAAQAKALSVPAYAIGKANASVDKALSKSLAPAINFYGAPGRKRALASTKQANQAKKQAKKAKTVAAS